MTQNAFMAQTHFFIPLNYVSREYRKRFDESQVVSLSFSSQRNEMLARFITLQERPFFFYSRPDGKRECFRKVNLRAYLLSYKMYASRKEEDFFLVIGADVDKFFQESYDGRAYTCPNQDFQKRICTSLDLIYLQEALRREARKGLFYPLQDSTEDHRRWIDCMAADIAGKSIGKKQKSVPLEYAAIDIRSAEVLLPLCFDEHVLNLLFNLSFYASEYLNFNSIWQGGDTLFALCLLKGNGNVNNVSARQIVKYKSHRFTNNKNEMTYAGKNGIVFLRTHHPFNIHSEAERDAIDKALPGDLKDVQNVYEICTVLCAKKKMEQLGCQLEKGAEGHVRHVLGRIAKFLNMKLTNVIDLDNKYRFVYEQMGVMKEFQNLKIIGELLADSYQLKLSRRINFIITIFTVSAFLVAAFQIFQNHINTYYTSMETKCSCMSGVMRHCENQNLFCYGDGIILLILCTLIAIIILIVLIEFVVYPLLAKLHKRLHRDMENED